MNFVRDPQLADSILRLLHNGDFQYLLKQLNRDANILMEQLVNEYDPEVAGVLKHFLLPFLRHCGSVEYMKRNIVEQTRKEKQMHWEKQLSGYEYTDRDV